MYKSAEIRESDEVFQKPVYDALLIVLLETKRRLASKGRLDKHGKPTPVLHKTTSGAKVPLAEPFQEECDASCRLRQDVHG